MAEPERLDSDALNALVQECADKWPDEADGVLERLCQQHPEHATALRRRVSLLERTGLLEAAAAATPRRLGEFALRGELGSGGMGVVYRALQESLQREVALKVIRPDHSFFVDSRQRFLREVNAVARLQHPGIVPVHVVGEDRGVLYYAMELVQGCTLAQVLAALQDRDPATLSGDDLARTIASLAPGEVDGGEPSITRFPSTWVESCLRLAQQVAQALEHAHGRGVLHRDVKPSNVMLTRTGRAMLLDFGLASTSGDTRITRSGAELGSLAYMAPEQVRGDFDAIAARTDVYAVGVLLYEMLTLSRPFACATTEATRQAILAGAFVPPRGRNRALAADAALVCQKAMDADPARRYQLARDLARDLGNVLELRPIEARPMGAWLRVRRAAQRHPARALSLAFAGVLLLGVFPALYLQQRSARLQLVAEKKRTDEALTEAETALARARWGLGKAREAVDHFLADIGEFRAVDIPLLEELRRETLQQAATLYEQLLDEPGGAADPKLVDDHARTLLGLAQVLRDLNRFTDVEPVLRRAEASLLAQPGGDDPERRRLLAATRSNLGSTLIAVGRQSEAELPLTQAADELRQLLGEVPSAELQAVMLRNSVALANLRRESKRTDEAVPLYEEAIRLGQGLEPRIDVLRILADAHSGLGTLMSDRGSIKAAEDSYLSSLELRRQIASRAPTSARFRRELAGDLERLGLLVQSWRANQVRRALTYMDESAALHSELVRDFPRQSAYRIGYCRARIMSARMHQSLGDDVDAERDFRDAIDNLEQVRSELPQETAWRAPLGFALYSLAQLEHAQGARDEALGLLAHAEDLATTLLQQDPDDSNIQQQQAEIHFARSAWHLLPDDEALASARRAFAMGLTFLRERADDHALRATAFRCFEHLVGRLLAREDVDAVLQVLDEYRAANPYKWLSQLTIAKTYLRCRGLLTDPRKRDECLAQGRAAVLHAAEHSLREVLRIEKDDVYAPIMDHADVVDVLARARAVVSDG